MKIFLPITLKPTGGTSSFAKKLQQGMAKLGHTVTFEYSRDYDILLVSPRCHLHYLLDAKRQHKPIIHRLDGVFYPATTAGRLWRLHNMSLSIIRKYFADTVIYQSHYSKKSCEKFLWSTKKPEHILHNGVDTDHFTPEGKAINLCDNPTQQIFITWSRFRRKDQIEPLVAAFAWYREKYEKNCKLIIIGEISRSLSGRLVRGTEILNVKIRGSISDQKGIRLIGTVSNQEIPLYARGADAFIMTHQNPPCPNNVIEAMACGLPICGIADGAMPELIAGGENGELVPVNDNGWWQFRQLNPQALADRLAKIMQNKNRYAAASRLRAMEKFSLNDMTTRYLEIFEKMLS